MMYSQIEKMFAKFCEYFKTLFWVPSWAVVGHSSVRRPISQ